MSVSDSDKRNLGDASPSSADSDDRRFTSVIRYFLGNSVKHGVKAGGKKPNQQEDPEANKD